MRFIFIIIWVLSIVSGCRDNSTKPKADAASLAQTYVLSGKILGIRPHTTVILQNNGGDDITISAGTTNFSFPTKIATGGSYNISVSGQTKQICTVTNGSGLISSAEVTDIIVKCSSKKYDQLASAPANFSDVLLLRNKFIVPESSTIKQLADEDSTPKCLDQIESKKELAVLNKKIKLERLAELNPHLNLPSKTEQKVIFLALGELKKCKQLGDGWRKESYSPEVLSVVGKSYSDLFMLLTNLYAKKISYSDYAKKNKSIHHKFDVGVATAIKQEGIQQAAAYKLKELEQEAEKLRLEALAQPSEEERARLAEEERTRQTEALRLNELAKKQAQLKQQEEAQRLIDLELQKQQQLEDEKAFQSLHQRQQLDRMR